MKIQFSSSNQHANVWDQTKKPGPIGPKWDRVTQENSVVFGNQSTPLISALASDLCNLPNSEIKQESSSYWDLCSIIGNWETFRDPLDSRNLEKNMVKSYFSYSKCSLGKMEIFMTVFHGFFCFFFQIRLFTENIEQQIWLLMENKKLLRKYRQ